VELEQAELRQHDQPHLVLPAPPEAQLGLD
jgi:hypothetical protein